MLRRWLALAASLPVALASLLGLFGLLLPRAAEANMARSSWRGDLHGPLLAQEPTTVRVESEELTFVVADHLGAAAVIARYQLRNDGPAPSGGDVAFAFVQGDPRYSAYSEAAQQPPTITIDGVAAELRILDGADQPPPQRRAWGAADHQRLSWLVFRLELAPGQTRTVEVRYLHRASEDLQAHVNPTYSFEYLLSPARSWAAFGALRLRVELPAAAELLDSTVPMARDGAGDAGGGAVYRAELSGLPAGELTFSIASTEGLWFGSHSRGPYYLVFGLALALLTLPFAARIGRRWRRNTPDSSRALLVLWTVLLVGAIAVGVGWCATEFAPRRAFGYGYETALRLFGCVVLDLLLAVIVALSFAGRAAPSRDRAGAG